MVIRQNGNAIRIYPFAIDDPIPYTGKWACKIDYDETEDKDWPVGFMNGRYTLDEIEKIANAMLIVVKMVKDRR